MGLADNRQHVMLAAAHQADVLQNDKFIIPSDFRKSLLQQCAGIDAIAAEQFGIGSHDPRRRLAQPFPRWIIACPGDEGADRRFRFFPRRVDPYFAMDSASVMSGW